jgi:hypothetical protein
VNNMTELQLRIARMVEAVEKDESHIGVLSTGEALTVALVLDRQDLFPHQKMLSGMPIPGYTMLEAMDRVGQEWLEAATAVQKNRS